MFFLTFYIAIRSSISFSFSILGALNGVWLMWMLNTICPLRKWRQVEGGEACHRLGDKAQWSASAQSTQSSEE